MKPTWTSRLCRRVPSDRGPYSGMPVLGSTCSWSSANSSAGSSTQPAVRRGRSSSSGATLKLSALFALCRTVIVVLPIEAVSRQGIVVLQAGEQVHVVGGVGERLAVAGDAGPVH